MLITPIKATLTVPHYGTMPASGLPLVVQKWLETIAGKALLTEAERRKKRGQEAHDAINDILNLVRRHPEGDYPILGDWMLKECLKETADLIFNAAKNKGDPKKGIVGASIIYIEPNYIPFFRNGEMVTECDGIETHAVTVKRGPGKGRSFFKAYEYINAGAYFGCEIAFEDSLITQEHIDRLLQIIGRVGVGAYRERFGKFDVTRL